MEIGKQRQFVRKQNKGECLLSHNESEAKSEIIERSCTVNDWEASTLPTELHPQNQFYSNYKIKFYKGN